VDLLRSLPVPGGRLPSRQRQADRLLGFDLEDDDAEDSAMNASSWGVMSSMKVARLGLMR